MANNDQARDDAPPVVNDGTPAASGASERTPLLGHDAGESSPGTAAGGAFSDNIRKWRRQRWASTLLAFLLVAAIVTLTLVFGGQHSASSVFSVRYFLMRRVLWRYSSSNPLAI